MRLLGTGAGDLTSSSSCSLTRIRKIGKGAGIRIREHKPWARNLLGVLVGVFGPALIVYVWAVPFPDVHSHCRDDCRLAIAVLGFYTTR